MVTVFPNPPQLLSQTFTSLVEPNPIDNSLVSADNILLTPHLGASTVEAKEGVSKGICQQVKDFLIEQKLSNVLNIPIADMSILKQIEPYLNMTEKLGILLSQLISDPVKSIKIECFGLIEELKPISISFLKPIFNISSASSITIVLICSKLILPLSIKSITLPGVPTII